MKRTFIFQIVESQTFVVSLELECSALTLSVDANAELDGHDPAADEGGEHRADLSVDQVTEGATVVGVSVAVAAVDVGARAGFHDGHDEHVDVPRLVNLVDLSTACLAGVEVLWAVDTFVTHLFLFLIINSN